MTSPRRIPPPANAATTITLSLVVCLGGCAGPLGGLIVSAPNRMNPMAGRASPLPLIEVLGGVDDQFFVDVGPPDARLSVSILDPPPEWGPPRATVLVLHGIFGRSFWMLGVAGGLAEAGYRTVLVDLRGQGASSGKYFTYGVRESADLAQVIDELERRGLVVGKLGVYGISYGGATSIHLAGRDPRITAVVAVAPFSNMRDEAPHFVRTMAPGVGVLIPEATYDRAIDEAGRRAGFDPEAADAVRAIRRTTAQVLLLHGTDDWIVPPWHAVRLHEAAGEHSELVLIPGLGHTTIWLDRDNEVAHRTRQWFGLWLGPPRFSGSP